MAKTISTIVKQEIEYNGYWFNPETNIEVMKVISGLNCYNRRQRVRIFLGDTKTGKTWNEENDVCGYIGRSTGSKKIPLLIHNNNSSGGGILTHCIVAIYTTSGTCLYKHEKLDFGKWDIREFARNETEKEYPFCAYCNDDLHARFKTYKQADNYVKFMTAKRFCK